jgi:CBS domain-containing protein
MLTARHLLERKGSEVHSVGPEDAVLDAIKLMAERHVGALLVMRGAELVGIVSERDYARKVILLGRSSGDTRVRQIMSSPVTTVTPGHTVSECMKIVTEQRVRHLPVVEQGRVVGVVSIGDLVKAVIEDQQQQIEQLERYITS